MLTTRAMGVYPSGRYFSFYFDLFISLFICGIVFLGGDSSHFSYLFGLSMNFVVSKKLIILFSVSFIPFFLSGEVD